MSKHSITIPLPEGWVLAKEGLHTPKEGEHYYSIKTQKVLECIQDWKKGNYFPIVQREWTPPASCPKGVIFTKSIGRGIWYTTISQPREEIFIPVEELYSDFTPPPYSPYTVE